MVRKILLLGNEELYRPSVAVRPDELASLRGLLEDMNDTLAAYRKRFGPGQTRALAAPQIGTHKRVIFVSIGGATAVINPIVHFPDKEMMELEEGCMSFPGLLVRTRRYRQCVLQYRNIDWQPREVILQDEMALLAQLGVDLLDGILATMRAVDNHAFSMDPAVMAQWKM